MATLSSDLMLAKDSVGRSVVFACCVIEAGAGGVLAVEVDCIPFAPGRQPPLGAANLLAADLPLLTVTDVAPKGHPDQDQLGGLDAGTQLGPLLDRLLGERCDLGGVCLVKHGGFSSYVESRSPDGQALCRELARPALSATKIQVPGVGQA